MKFNLPLILILLGLFCSSSLSGQDESFRLKFDIWKKTPAGDVYLGNYEEVVSKGAKYNHTTTTKLSQSICPGDQLVLRNLCEIEVGVGTGNFVSHDFTGLQPNFGQMTIGLTNQHWCSYPTNPPGPVPISHLANVGNFYSPSPPNTKAPGYRELQNWKYGTRETITVTPWNSLDVNQNVYLAISAGRFGDIVNPCGCGNRYFFIPLDLKEGVDTIPDQDLCPGDVVNLNLSSDYTYNNWSPSNPDGTTPSTTASYTVEVVNNNTGCTLSDEFEIKVNQPIAGDIVNKNFLCYNEFITIDLDAAQSDYTSSIVVNGKVVYDVFTQANELPYYISGLLQGDGVIDVAYTYWTNTQQNQTCTKTYQITIDQPINLSVTDVAVCTFNFQPICASIPQQAGIGYTWSQGSTPVATTNCFTPTAHGAYTVVARRQSTGCRIDRTIQVTNPGVGISHPGDIEFCSLIGQSAPSIVGWSTNPFPPTMLYGFQWTFQSSGGGSPVPISASGGAFNVPYMGVGTYTARVVDGNGCLEFFTINVQDRLQEFNNHPNAAFSTNIVNSPPGTTKFEHVSTVSVQGGVPSWVVRDASGSIVPHTVNPMNGGINYFSSTGDPLHVTLSIIREDSCEIYRKSNKLQGRLSEGNTGNVAAFDQKLDLQVFPNPTTGNLTILLGDAAAPGTTMRVINSLGQVLIAREVQEQSEIQVDLSTWAAGLYQIELANGKNRAIKTVVKQ